LAFVVTVAAAIAVLHEKPVPDVHFRALDEVEHDGTVCPVGATAVREPSNWFAPRAPVSVPAVVAAIVPEPEVDNEAPVPTSIAAVVFVPPIRALKFDPMPEVIPGTE
jgi:hypothetical protein